MNKNHRISLSFDASMADRISNYALPCRPTLFIRVCVSAVLSMALDQSKGTREVPFIVKMREGGCAQRALGAPAKYSVSFTAVDMNRLRVFGEVTGHKPSKLVRICVEAILEMGKEPPGKETIPWVVVCYDAVLENRRLAPPSKVCYADFRSPATPSAPVPADSGYSQPTGEPCNIIEVDWSQFRRAGAS